MNMPTRASRLSRLRTPKFIYILIAILIMAATSGVVVMRAVRPLPAAAVTLKINDIDGEVVALPWTASGKSAIAPANGPVLAKGPSADTKVPIASIAKLITVLTVLKKYPLRQDEQGPVITLGESDVALRSSYGARGGSTIPVQAGEKVTEYQMIQAMLLPSANNMADSLAIWAYGSLAAYKVAAQELVNGYGMSSTTIGDDASGLSPSTVSTARDLVILGQAAYRQPVIREIARQQTADLPVAGTVYTTNDALGKSGITGLKTGTSDEAGECLLFSASHTFADGQTREFIGVVMDSGSDASRFSDATVLLDATYENYADRAVALGGQTLGTVTTAWGKTGPVIAKADLRTFIWRGDGVKVTAATTPQKAAVQAGAIIGDVKANSSSALLVTKDALPEPDLWWRITHW